ncbi:protein NETWORKED 2D [Carica papaya]|uniref:protein NETWORKED 2D n=1 Tax=Carica papaya TaxID=3649 RepID=UPI000B8D0BFD|nr:protein NETWORKED 2D [Carica papaya]
MEEKLNGIQDLDQNVEDRSDNLQTHFTEACCNLDHLSEKLENAKPEEELEANGLPVLEENSLFEVKKESEGREIELDHCDGSEKLQNANADEELHVSDSAQKQDKITRVKFKDQEEEMEHGDVSEEATDAKTDVGDSMKEHNLPNTGRDRDQSEDASNLQASNDPSSLSEKQASPVTEDNSPSNKLASLSEKETSFKGHDNSSDGRDQGKDASPSHACCNGPDSLSEKEISSQEAGNLLGNKPDNLLGNKPDNLAEEETSTQNLDDPLIDRPDDVLEKEDLTRKPENLPSNDSQGQELEKEDEPDWKKLFMNGSDERQKLLLTEYTTVLRNYKDVKKRFSEEETKLKDSNAKKDEEINVLRKKLSLLLQKGLADNNDVKEIKVSENQNELSKSITRRKDAEIDLGMMLMDHQTQTISPIEEQFRMNIDELLEENLDFWLRFSTSFHQIQKFDTGVQDLQAEISKLEERRKTDGSSTARYALRSDVRPIYRHLREIHTELTVWLEKSALLKDELKSRFSSLCNIQDEITKALKTSAEDYDFTFTSFQAAKFQGEILNMKQENNKVADELQAGLDHITSLQLEVEKILAKLTEDFGLSGSKRGQLEHSDSRSRVPLRSFIFGVKPKKPRQSIFSCMHPSAYRKIRTS